jgi:hypothetical protein
MRKTIKRVKHIDKREVLTEEQHKKMIEIIEGNPMTFLQWQNYLAEKKSKNRLLLFQALFFTLVIWIIFSMLPDSLFK